MRSFFKEASNNKLITLTAKSNKRKTIQNTGTLRFRLKKNWPTENKLEKIL